MTESSFSRRQVASMVAAGAGTGAAAMMAPAPPRAAAQQSNATQPWLDIRDYGAMGDGVADDTQAIQDAVDTANSNDHGGIVALPPGEFRITGPVSLGSERVNILGAGRHQTVFLCADESASLRFGDLGGDHAGNASRSGGFSVDGANVSWNPMNVGRSNKRMFFDITISRGIVGLALGGTQNATFENIVVRECSIDDRSVGLLFDHGAGGNVVVNCQLVGNTTNVMFRNSTDGSFDHPYQGRPSDNTFIGGQIETASSYQATEINCDHRAGSHNQFLNTLFAGAVRHSLVVRHQLDDPADTNPERRPHGSDQLHLLGCVVNSGTASAIQHTARNAPLRVTSTLFYWVPSTIFELGDDCRVEIDSLNHVTSTPRFANAPGGTQSEEELIRRETFHPHNVTTPGDGNIALQTWVGTAIARRTSHPLYRLDASGRMAWGPGADSADVALGRTGPGKLRVDGTLVAQDGIGAGNSEPATELGQVVRRMQVFDEDGNPLGYVPVYDSIS